MYHLKGGRKYLTFVSTYLRAITAQDFLPNQVVSLLQPLLDYYLLAALQVNGKFEDKLMPFGNIRFLPFRLSEEDKKKFAEFAVKAAPELGMYFTDLVLGGYKISLSYAPKSETFVATVTCRVNDHVNSGLGISSHHQQADAAIFVALYKHFVVIGETPWLEYAVGDDWG